MTWLHTPMSLEDERHVGDFEAECERYDGSDEFLPDAWDWLTSLPTPPEWLADLLWQHYPQSTAYVSKIEDRLDGEW